MAKQKSSFISDVSYDAQRKDLSISMKTGSTYIYTPVPQDIAEFFDTYNSKGEAYNTLIKRNKAFKCMRVLK